MSNEAAEKTGPIQVNGETVNEGLVRQELQGLRERYALEMSPAEMEARAAKIESDARENAVERVLLTQQARRVVPAPRPEEIEARFMAMQEQHGGAEAFQRQFDLSEDDIAKLKADLADGVRLEKYFDELCADAVRPTEAETRAYYEAHPERFRIPEQVHAAHIVHQPSPELPVERVNADLLNIRERLLAGEDFDLLAAQYSHAQPGQQDLGWFGRGKLVQPLEDAAFGTPEGGISDVVQTAFGYHVLQVRGREPARVQPFEEVRFDIEAMLFDERKNAVIGAAADALRAAADIQNLVIIE